jgi:hypothetical protein
MTQFVVHASRRLLIVAALCLSVATGCGGKAGGPPDPSTFPTTFKAKVKFSSAPGRPGLSDPVIYRLGDNFRSEVSFNNVSSATIFRVDQKKAYTLIPASKTYFESPLDEKLLKQFELVKSLGVWPGAKVEPLGDEPLNGHPCVKLKITAKINDQDAASVLWCATDLKNLPIKIESDINGQKTVLELTDVSFDVDPKAFEPPPDFQKKDFSGVMSK